MKHLTFLFLYLISFTSYSQCVCEIGTTYVNVEAIGGQVGDTWSIVDSDGLSILSGGFGFNQEICIDDDKTYYVSGYSQNNYGWNGGEIVISTFLGQPFFTFTTTSVYNSASFVPHIDGYVESNGSVCNYEIRDEFGNLSWSSCEPVNTVINVNVNTSYYSNITWSLENSDGQTLLSGGPYLYNTDWYNYSISLPGGDYYFVMDDQDGDMYCCNNSSIEYSVTASIGGGVDLPLTEGNIISGNQELATDHFNSPYYTTCNAGNNEGCDEQLCVIPSNKFQIVRGSENASTLYTLRKIIGSLPSEGVIFDGTLTEVGTFGCPSCLQSPIMPTCGCSIENNDSDNICDDIDDCFGDIDECGVCGGDGIPSGFCDCNGNQLDVIGVCGGGCFADEDGDGLCDAEDDCIGEYDECGVCNGFGTPLGYCDCDGVLVTDAVGVCGGNCDLDININGVCDTEETIGCMDQSACNFQISATVQDEYSCEFCSCLSSEIEVFAMDFGSIVFVNGQIEVYGDWLLSTQLGSNLNIPPPTDQFFINVSVAKYIGLAFTEQNQVYTWGFEFAGATSEILQYNNEIRDVVALEDGALVFFENGSIETIGSVSNYILDDLPSQTEVQSVVKWSHGYNNLLGLTESGEIIQVAQFYGGNSGAAYTPDYITGARDILMTTNRAYIVLENGDLYRYGNNYTAQILNVNYEISAIFPNSNGESCAVFFTNSNDGWYDVWGSMDSANGVLSQIPSDEMTITSVSAVNPGSWCVYAAGNIVGGVGYQFNNEDNYFPPYPVTYQTGIGYPEGDCDCYGHQLDAIGICNGVCLFDADNDGICDDVDDCVGIYDECGVCNGQGPQEGFCDCEGSILDECGICGGAGITNGDCDCEGNVLDECGICGGNGIPEGTCTCEGEITLECIGCTFPFASNYDDAALINNGTCEYNLQELIDDGACIQSLLDGGAIPEQFIGLSYGDNSTIINLDNNTAEALVMHNLSIGEYPWGCNGVDVAGTSSDFGEGLNNTLLILTSECQIFSNEITAVKAAINFNFESWDDWFLPSELELSLAYCDVITPFYGGNIWTSTQYNGNENQYGGPNAPLYKAISQDPYNGCLYSSPDSKTSVRSVYPMRTHDITKSWDGTACINNVVLGCVIESACNFNPSATVDNGNCILPDICGECGNDENPDVDNDGICDVLDDCVGEYDECGVCNGTGIPEGFCACNGNQLDALGICGGVCTSDFDADGLCDDIDDCVGEYDECGVCNGIGIPEGSCDCDGNELDALGICGGGCTSDNNNNNVCDDQEVPGCADQEACNYQDSATQDDGTCEYCSCIITEPLIDLSSHEYASVLLNSNGIVDYYSFDPNGNDMTGLETISHPDINDRFIQVDMHGGNDEFVVCGLTNENSIELWGSYNPVILDDFTSIFSSSYGYSKVIIDGSSSFSIMALNEFGGLEGFSTTSNYQNLNPLPDEVAYDIVDFDFDNRYVAAATSSGEIWVWFTQGVQGSILTYDWGYTQDDGYYYNGNWMYPYLKFEPNTIASLDISYNYIAILFNDGTTEVISHTNSLEVNIPPFDDLIDIQAVYDGVFTLRGNGQLSYWGNGSETTFNQIPDALFLSFTAKHDRISAIDVDGNIHYWSSWSGSTPFQGYPHASYINIDNYINCGVCIDEDQDNICDDIDDCVGEIDLCGVCNGPGVTYQCGCDPIADGACDCFGNLIDECGVCGGNGSSCVQTCLDDDDAVSAVGGCVNAVAVLGCSFYWNDVLISEWCPQSCNSCPCENDFNENGVCDENEVFGCAYIDAINYDAFVTTDNGSCVFELVSSNCPADIDGDGFVATTDLLMFLSSFGEDCE